MSDNYPVLLVEDDPDLRDAMRDTLQLAQYNVLEAENGKQALEILSSKNVSLIISDVQMPEMDGHELLKEAKARHPDIPFVLVTAYASVPQAVEAIREGAADYIIKPFDAQILIEVVERLLPKINTTDNLVTEDEKSIELTNLARRVAQTDVSVMVSGDSGCGKEVYARFIHNNSSRKNEPFVAINCAAIPESMLESILFGYEKGAFTGAYTARAGKFEQANHGTLLLDEISEMDLGLQAKLLRVLQEKEVERLGSGKNIPLDVRIIATTNRDLKQEVMENRFREDLFYRLNVFPLRLSPLRDRKADIMPLAEKIVEDFNPGQGVSISQQAAVKLHNHSWPGNVRELENVIQRALILKQGSEITGDNIVFEHAGTVTSPSSPAPSIPSLEMDSPALEDQPEALENNLKQREQEIIIDALANHASKKEAAETLGISPRTLRYKLAQFKKEGINIPCMHRSVSAG